jgi:hypothetical protein
MHKMAEKRKRKETVTSYGHDEEGNGENGIKEEGIEQPLKKQKSALNEHQEQVSICLMLFINILTRNFRIFTCPSHIFSHINIFYTHANHVVIINLYLPIMHK